MKIGIFSTFIEPAALDLVNSVQGAVKSGEIPNTEISFIFSNREQGDDPATDKILDTLNRQDTRLMTFSAPRFKPDMRRKARQEEKSGSTSLMQEWRNQFGEEVLKRLPRTDVDLLLGDMYIWGDNMCDERNGINLHPALPWGPKGEWYKVIWQLIQDKSQETGVMMHKVTPELDRGPAIAYCRFPIRDSFLTPLWNRLPRDPRKLEEVIRQGLIEKEKANHPLFKEIRNRGFTRETPLIVQTTKAFTKESLRLEGGTPVDRNGIILREGYDLTSRIDTIVSRQLEGQNFARKEVF